MTGSRVDLARMRRVEEEDRRRAEAGEGVQVTTRVVALLLREAEKEARSGRFVLRSDEPEPRGGGGRHTAPPMRRRATWGRA